MSRGISWRQVSLLESIAGRTGPKQEPVAWRDLDYGPTDADYLDYDDYYSVRTQWNIEQATRRALRSLERRGLITLGRHVFMHVAGSEGASLEWSFCDPDRHVPGDTRIMTGALLTEAGVAELAYHERRKKAASTKQADPLAERYRAAFDKMKGGEP